MSKNIIIQESGTNYQFTAKKLKTDKVGGGTCLWIPEDEVNLITKIITENGKHLASADNAYGFKSVNVRVKGGKGSANSNGTPKVTYDSDGNEENAPGGIGSSVVGQNPTTGEWEAVGVDSNGNLVTTILPNSIDLIANPTKMSYQDGETIVITGATVVAKKADGTTWTNSTYPNGHVPLGELSVNPSIASASGGGGGGGTGPGTYSTPWGTLTITAAPNDIIVVPYYNMAIGEYWPNVAIFSKENALISFEGTGIQTTSPVSRFLLFDGVYGYNIDFDGVYCSNAEGLPVFLASDDWAAYIDGHDWDQGSNTITLTWKRPGDDKELNTTFNVAVTGSSGTTGDTSSGSGYSDDSGGSSSGGGGGF